MYHWAVGDIFVAIKRVDASSIALTIESSRDRSSLSDLEVCSSMRCVCDRQTRAYR